MAPSPVKLVAARIDTAGSVGDAGGGCGGTGASRDGALALGIASLGVPDEPPLISRRTA